MSEANIFGGSCVGCRARGPLLCNSCRERVLPSGETRRPVHVDRLIVPWAYDGVARDLVLRLKVRGAEDAAEPLAAAMAEHVHATGLRAVALTWVPGRRGDIRRRGFDHAEVLARALGRRLGLPCVPLLARRGTQADQAGLGARDRAANLRDAFIATAPSDPIAIVDDVVTTGSTLSSCARALRRAGARSVEAVVSAAA